MRRKRIKRVKLNVCIDDWTEWVGGEKKVMVYSEFSLSEIVGHKTIFLYRNGKLIDVYQEGVSTGRSLGKFYETGALFALLKHYGVEVVELSEIYTRYPSPRKSRGAGPVTEFKDRVINLKRMACVPIEVYEERHGLIVYIKGKRD